MDLFQMALNANQLGNLGFINNNNMSGNEKLREQLYHCTYSDEYFIYYVEPNLLLKNLLSKFSMFILISKLKFYNSVINWSITAEQGQQKRFI